MEDLKHSDVQTVGNYLGSTSIAILYTRMNTVDVKWTLGVINQAYQTRVFLFATLRVFPTWMIVLRKDNVDQSVEVNPKEIHLIPSPSPLHSCRAPNRNERVPIQLRRLGTPPEPRPLRPLPQNPGLPLIQANPSLSTLFSSRQRTGNDGPRRSSRRSGHSHPAQKH